MKYFKKEFWGVFLVLLLVAGAYALTLRGVAGNPSPKDLLLLEDHGEPFELSPERGRYAHVVSLSENKSYALNKDLADFVYPDVGYHDGRFYSFFAPGMSYMAIPFYLIGQKFGLAQVGTFAFVSFIALMGLLTLYKICRNIMGMRVWSSLFSVLTFGMATTSWSYAITLYQHHVTLFFMLMGFYAAWKFKNSLGIKSWLWGSVVWGCYALAITVDYPNIILLLPVMLYFMISSFELKTSPFAHKISFRSAFVFSCLLFVAITALHLNHNQREFGNWRKLSGELTSYKTVVEENLTNAPDIEQAVEDLKGEKNAIKFFSEENLPLGLSILTFSTDRGLYLFSPILLLAFFGIWKLGKGFKIEHAAILMLVLVNIFLYGSWGDPWGGWAFGPRYLIPTMAWAAVFVGYWFDGPKPAIWKRLIAFVLFGYSLAVAILGAMTSNAVPPKIEAIALKTDYNFIGNYKNLVDGLSGSYMYNHYLARHITLFEVGLLSFWAILFITAAILFIMPRYEND